MTEPASTPITDSTPHRAHRPVVADGDLVAAPVAQLLQPCRAAPASSAPQHAVAPSGCAPLLALGLCASCTHSTYKCHQVSLVPAGEGPGGSVADRGQQRGSNAATALQPALTLSMLGIWYCLWAAGGGSSPATEGSSSAPAPAARAVAGDWPVELEPEARPARDAVEDSSPWGNSQRPWACCPTETSGARGGKR